MTNSQAVVRTITSYQKQLTYSYAQQVEDSGVIQTTINVKIYQISLEVGRGYPATATLTPTFQESTPIITGFNPMAGLEGDTVTVFGSGLAGVTAVTIGGVSATNLAVVSDNEISFAIAPETVSGLIQVVTPGGSSSSSNSFVINNSGSSPTTSQPGSFGTFEFTTESITHGSFENFDLSVGALVTIREISLSHQGRLRLFGAESDRTADNTDVNTSLNIDEAVDFYLASGNLTKKFIQGLILNNLEDPIIDNLYGKVFNDSGTDNALALTIKYYANASINIGGSSNPWTIDQLIQDIVFCLDGSDQNNFQDKSTNAISPLNSSDSFPTYEANALDNQSIISFNGIDQYLGYSASIFSTTSDFHNYVVLLAEKLPNIDNFGRIAYWSQLIFI